VKTANFSSEGYTLCIQINTFYHFISSANPTIWICEKAKVGKTESLKRATEHQTMQKKL